MSSRKKINLSQLTLQDVICPICLSILIEPVTMPCSHSLCMPCFNQHVAETALACPMCRMRISVWVRRTSKSNRLINNRLWEVIKEKFPEKIEARMQGTDDIDDEEVFVPETRVCEPGEIRQEYEAMIQREQEELASRRSQEEEASARLILKLQEEEKMKLRQRKAQEEQMYQEDEILAIHIKKEEKDKAKVSTKIGATPAKGPMDMYIGQKTPRSHGKLLVPDMPHSSKLSSVSSMSSKHSGYLMSPKSLAESLSTPSSSKIFNESRGFPQSNLIPTNDFSDSKLGRSLREITSSQSSESDSEDLMQAVRRKKANHANTSGKENVDMESDSHIADENSESKLISPNKTRSPSKIKRKKISRLFRHSCSESDIEDLNNRTSIDLLSHIVNGDDDETDIEDSDSDFKVRVKEKVQDGEQRSYDTRKSISSMQESFEKEGENYEVEKPIIDNNVSLDYSLFFSNEGLSADIEKLKDEQRLIEERLKQEEQDRLLAECLQKQFNDNPRLVDRSRGSGDEYALRHRKSVKSPIQIKSSQKRERQTTLTEALAKRQKKS